MKKVLLSVVAALAVAAAAPAFAADMPVKAKKVIVATPSPWDIAFGTALTSDYVLRGVSQSNGRPAVQGYFELRYNVNDMIQLYAGVWSSSLWTGFANAEIDPNAGVRLTYGNFGLDVGYVYYGYPGGISAATAVPAFANGSYGEIYAKPSYKFNDMLTISGIYETGFNNFNGKATLPGGVWVGDARHSFYSVNAMITLPWQPAGITISINPEIGREVYSSGVTANYGSVSDTFWDVGLIFNYKAATLDLRYWGSNVKTAPIGTAANQCGSVAAGTNFCGDRYVATLKFDTTFSALK